MTQYFVRVITQEDCSAVITTSEGTRSARKRSAFVTPYLRVAISLRDQAQKDPTNRAAWVARW